MKFTFIDLFAGIGGFHEAAKELGGHCVFASEIDKFAQQTYEANHGMKPQGDITKIDAKHIPDHDILFAGFPCQAFSVAGKRLGFEDTRGTLFFEIARILKEKQPKMFLLENVKGLKNHNDGKTLEVILTTLKDLGYEVHYTVLNARDYGVPQNRERIFFVGFKEPRAFAWPEKKPKIILSEYFGGYWHKDIANTVRSSGRGSGIDDKHNWDSYLVHDCKKHLLTEKAINRMEKWKLNGATSTCLLEKNATHTPTLRSTYYKDCTKITINDTCGIRKLSPKECGLLQGFPESFIIPVSDTQAYKQFGNAVCVPVVKAILKQILFI